jgi:hypothetical protein
MASQTEICNRALDKLGAQSISNIADNAEVARVLNRAWNLVRDDELRARKWSFAIKRASLAASVTPPTYQYGANYPLPVDCLRVLSLFGYDIGPNLSDYLNGQGQPYVIEGRAILYGTPGAGSYAAIPLRYLARIEDTTQWDSAFTETFACRLAAEVAEKITQSSDKRKLAWQEYTQSLGKAKRANAIELPPDYIADDSWVMARVR